MSTPLLDIQLTDTDAEVRFDPETKAGVSNLLVIHSVLSGTPVPDLEQAFAGRGYGDLKKEVADVVVAAVEPFQARMRELLEKLIADHSGKTPEEVNNDIERDKILTAEAAIEYGLIDQILESRKAVPV